MQDKCEEEIAYVTTKLDQYTKKEETMKNTKDYLYDQAVERNQEFINQIVPFFSDIFRILYIQRETLAEKQQKKKKTILQLKSVE